jgi:hypothetical protein
MRSGNDVTPFVQGKQALGAASYFNPAGVLGEWKMTISLRNDSSLRGKGDERRLSP